MVSPLMEVSFTFVQKGLTNTDMAVLNFGEAQGYLYKDGFHIFLKIHLAISVDSLKLSFREKGLFSPSVFFIRQIIVILPKIKTSQLILIVRRVVDYRVTSKSQVLKSYGFITNCPPPVLQGIAS